MGKRASEIIMIVSLLASGALVCLAFGKAKPKDQSLAQGMTARQRAIHGLNRLTFGPRPGDIDRVLATGVDRWIDQQLHPDKIADSALEGRLAYFPSLRMSNRELVENFPPPQLIKAVANGKQPLPSDSMKRAIYERQLERYEEKQERKETSAQPSTGDGATDSERLSRAESEPVEQAAEPNFTGLLDLPPDQRFKSVLAMSPEQQGMLLTALKGRSDEFLTGMTARQREVVRALNNPQQVVVQELADAKLLRAVYSERQLQEVMTDFWFNHFNVFIGKGADRYLLTSYEREVIRPHAFGKFEDLLVATAKSPAMLFYLDNWLSVGPNSEVALGIPKRALGFGSRSLRPHAAKHAGLNENYGRELLELHTLGVNGGYTQKDVTGVARVFTGWTTKEPRKGGGFEFDERRHEPGDKVVLGHRIKSKGEKEGLQVLHLLAHNPSTARFICTKLAIRFVSDDPPPSLIEGMTRTFLQKDGDIREVLRTMLTSPEFWAPNEYRVKVKTPFEFVVSSLRASGADIHDANPIVRQLQNMGMPLYGAQPPTGYSMKADAWVNSSALLGRMNFAMALTAGKLKGVQIDSDRLLPPTASDPQETLAALEIGLLAGDVSKQTHNVIESRLEDPSITRRKLDDPARPPNAAIVEGLLLGSPEFQRR